jgi:GH24 family phage-related lysozyme (muramidase)
LSGSKAEALCDNFTGIKITINAADDVFYRYTVPNYYKQRTEVFPGIDEFPGEVQGAMLSLVFNRGSSTKGEKRKEMKGIRDLVKNGHHDAQTLGEIARLLREMKRLWEGKGLAGLIARREAEARMVESAIV